MTHTWDPDRYLTYADERGRPFVELLARVDAADPATVVDLGCGPGNLTALLAERWPGARRRRPRLQRRDDRAGRGPRRRRRLRRRRPARLGAPARTGRRPGLQRDAAVGARPPRPAARRWSRRWRPGGWLAFQVPGNFDEPSHTIRAELAARGAVRRAHRRGGGRRERTTRRSTCDALRRPRLRGRRVGDDVPPRPRRATDPVFTWVSGTGARPTLQALPDDLRPGFEEEFKRRLRAAYPDAARRRRCCRSAASSWSAQVSA